MNTDPVDNQGTPQLTPGRVVHYIQPDGQLRGAFVTEYLGGDDQLANLLVGQTYGFEPQTSVPFGGPDKPNTWFWPERQ